MSMVYSKQTSELPCAQLCLAIAEKANNLSNSQITKYNYVDFLIITAVIVWQLVQYHASSDTKYCIVINIGK